MLSQPCILPLVHLCLEMPAMRQDHVTCSWKQKNQGWAGLSWDWPGSQELSRTEAATSPRACFNRTSGLHAKVLVWRASVRPKHSRRMAHTCSLKLYITSSQRHSERVSHALGGQASGYLSRGGPAQGGLPLPFIFFTDAVRKHP